MTMMMVMATGRTTIERICLIGSKRSSPSALEATAPVEVTKRLRYQE